MTKNKMHALFLQMQEQAQTPTPQCDEKKQKLVCKSRLALQLTINTHLLLTEQIAEKAELYLGTGASVIVLSPAGPCSCN